MLKINFDNKDIEVKEGTTYIDLVKNKTDEKGRTCFLVSANNIVKELRRNVKENETIIPLYYDNNDVKFAYSRTAVFIFIKALKNAFPNAKNYGFKFRIHDGYYFEVDDEVINESHVETIKKEFDEIVKADVEIIKKTYPKQQALEIFDEVNLEDVKLLFLYNYRPVINLRYIGNYVRYINGSLLYSTGFLKHYKIATYNKGVVLFLSGTDDEREAAETKIAEVYFNSQNSIANWAKTLKINTVGKLNRHIAKYEFNDLVIMSESYQDKRIGDIAEAIHASGKKLVFIAGPSSSGKTSFSHRLMYHLRALELNPYPIACDNFFVDRHLCPKDKNGEYEFEILEAVDIKLLNDTLNKILSGEETELPRYDFLLGKKVYDGTKIKIDDKDIVILEGIHCLNPKLTPVVDHNKIFKIYISALNEMSIDNANRIATSDVRLIRRIVRDSLKRGHNAKATIKMWKKVREGEEKSIFPFQEEADVFFNSSLIYELSVLKNYALPLLYDISEDPEVGETAKRLIKILNYFLGVSTDAIPRHSILREFLGDSIMDVN